MQKKGESMSDLDDLANAARQAKAVKTTKPAPVQYASPRPQTTLQSKPAPYWSSTRVILTVLAIPAVLISLILLLSCGGCLTIIGIGAAAEKPQPTKAPLRVLPR